MPLADQNVPLNIAQGVDTKTDPKQVVMGKFLSLENGTMVNPKEFQKRNGHVALSQNIDGTGTITSAAALATFKSELTLATGVSSFYSFTQANNNWEYKGTHTGCEVTSQPVHKNKYNQLGADVAYHSSGLALFISMPSYSDSALFATTDILPTVYSIQDTVTGEWLVYQVPINNQALSSGKPYVVGNFFIILYKDANTGFLRYVSIPVATPLTVSAPITLYAGPVGFFDADTLGTKLYVAYPDTTPGAAVIYVLTISNALVVSAAVPISIPGLTSIINVAVDTSLSQIWVTRYGNGIVDFAVINAALGLVHGFTAIEVIASIIAVSTLCVSGSCHTFYTADPGPDPRSVFIKYTVTQNSGAFVTPVVFIRSLSTITRPFLYNGFVHVVAQYFGIDANGSPIQQTAFLVNNNITNVGGLHMPQIVAKIATWSASPDGSFSHIWQTSSGKFLFSMLQLNQVFNSATQNIFPAAPSVTIDTTGSAAVYLNFISANNYQSREVGNSLFLTGGFLSMYDGTRIVEHNFHIYPELKTTDFTASNVGGTIQDGHDYSYSLTYEWMDAFGQLHISTPSSGVTVNVPANGGANTSKVTIVIPTLRVTSKGDTLGAWGSSPSPVMIGVYRTQKDPGLNAIYYKVFDESVILFNNTQVDTVTFIDKARDTTISANLELYTVGGVVQNGAAPASSLVATYKSRLLSLCSESKCNFWFSEQVVPGTPVTFSPLLTWNVDLAGGDVTALAQLDDKLIIWKANTIFWMVGDGPANTGALNDFTNPQQLPTDTGCTNPRSVCLFPGGIIYQSNNGWYLLDRSLSVKYIGADVEAYNSKTVTATLLVPGTTQIRVLLSDGTSQANWLIYDFFLDQWHFWNGLSAPVGATIFESAMTWANSSGLVQKETPGTFTDNGTSITMKIITSWLQFGGIQGFKRMKEMEILGTYKSNHTLNVQVAYDFNSTPTQTTTFAVTATPEQYGVFFDKQKCEAMQITLFDSNQTGTKESLSLSAFTFRAGVKKGLNKLPAAQAAG